MSSSSMFENDSIECNKQFRSIYLNKIFIDTDINLNSPSSR